MHLPPSSNPNVLDRVNQPVLIDFFAKEAAEQYERANHTHQQTPFAGLNSRIINQLSPPPSGVNCGISSYSNVTVTTLRRFLHENGDCDSDCLMDATIINRLNWMNISAESFLSALELSRIVNHTSLANLRINAREQAKLISQLGGILTRKQGFGYRIRKAIENTNNNPEQLIACLIGHIRNQSR